MWKLVVEAAEKPNGPCRGASIEFASQDAARTAFNSRWRYPERFGFADGAIVHYAHLESPSGKQTPLFSLNDNTALGLLSNGARQVVSEALLVALARIALSDLDDASQQAISYINEHIHQEMEGS